ncbi:glutathione S-transferase C-terminal domain-containing protein [Marivita sp. XM-24bin2]|jgi:putative glutathione S-transferase|uniref:glutathione S-transferase C-terminal domain-containing protein n=1 Tax=unclassified Marivita TaxID=2632480 RepID=UPI000D795A1F|nr:glutathione S-transferase C-terminal domain-containing protein [Marivita sp. XM-24bin2]MCR9108429.1 glutathione S-transferase C-terminal domain-containing protein [Paracoccaceae bacterium]PWL34377.1 MAG: glutathione S-transferase [Marivita sp. XM-24bin2]
MTQDTATQEDQSKAAERRAKGEFVRGVSGFRHAIGDPDFPPEPGRYHLFVALNCPWCHRATLARSVLGLTGSISMDVAFPNRTGEDDPAGPNLWEFTPDRIASLTGDTLPECTPETGTGQGLRLAKQIYQHEGSDEQSLPVLYDKITQRIVNNESAEILRMLDAHADALRGEATSNPTLFPDDPALQSAITDLNERIYTTINNGAYKAGFSSDQKVYATAFAAYFDTLKYLNALLSDGRAFLTGDRFTEADLRLFPTLFRHDPVYYLRMKLNGAKIVDFPHLWRWLCRVYALEGVAEAGSLVHCRQGYFGRSWNNVVPLGPTHPMPYPEAYRHPELARSG